MTTLCLVNRKGGVGKTTLTLALADFLSTLHGRRILIVDLDPQASATLALIGEERWFEIEQNKQTIADLFEQAYQEQHISANFYEKLIIYDIEHIKYSPQSLSLIASTPRLQEIEEDMIAGGDKWRYYAGSPYFILHTAFHKIFQKYDYVLIDCPSSLGIVTMNGLTVANGYLIPTIADHVSTIGIGQVIEKIQKHAGALKRKIQLYGTVINRFKTSTLLHQARLTELANKDRFHPIWHTKIPEMLKAKEAYHLKSSGLPTLKRRYGGTDHNYYQTIKQLSEEFLQRVS